MFWVSWDKGYKTRCTYNRKLKGKASCDSMSYTIMMSVPLPNNYLRIAVAVCGWLWCWVPGVVGWGGEGTSWPCWPTDPCTGPGSAGHLGASLQLPTETRTEEHSPKPFLRWAWANCNQKFKKNKYSLVFLLTTQA